MKRRFSGATWFLVLHLSFALTGAFHAVGGPLLPSIAAQLHLSDSQAGRLFFFYFLGASLAALFCVRRYGHLMRVGFALTTAAALSVIFANRFWSFPVFLLLGIGVGIPMATVSMIVGQRFGERSAAPLTFLNFSWSAGALLSPLLGAQILLHNTFRAAYGVLGLLAFMAMLACSLVIGDEPEQQPTSSTTEQQASNTRWIILFAFLTFLEVGVENTSITWLATYALRNSAHGAALAAASTSVYWIGFLLSRGISSWLLTHLHPFRLLATALLSALIGASLLIAIPTDPLRTIAMALLGASLAPLFPLLLSFLFARVPKTSDSRWVLACCGFGGSVLPWLVGIISTHTSSLRLGLTLIPAALLLILAFLPTLRVKPTPANL